MSGLGKLVKGLLDDGRKGWEINPSLSMSLCDMITGFFFSLDRSPSKRVQLQSNITQLELLCCEGQLSICHFRTSVLSFACCKRKYTSSEVGSKRNLLSHPKDNASLAQCPAVVHAVGGKMTCFVINQLCISFGLKLKQIAKNI